MAELTLNVKKREISTKGALNKLRKEGYVPGVFYAKEQKDQFYFYLPEKDLNPLIYTSETHMVTLKSDDGAEYKAILKDTQFDPVTDRVIHVDFQGITFGEVITVQIPVVHVGASEGVKEGGILTQFIHKLDIECLPRQIPDKIEVDISHLGIGDSLHVKDVKVENAKILNPEDAIIFTITPPKTGVEEVPTEAEEEEEKAEPEVISKGKSEEE
jgi:large subunit ribosomal protein L25